MKVLRFESADRYEPEKDWRRLSLCSEKDISIEHFVKPPHHASPKHDHPNAQVLVVLAGKLAVATGESGEQVLGEGDAAYIPAGEPHVVKNVLDAPSIGLDIFVPGRSFDFWAKGKERQPPRPPLKKEGRAGGPRSPRWSDSLRPQAPEGETDRKKSS